MVIGGPVNEEEQRCNDLMDMELIPADQVRYQAYSHHSSSSSLNSPPLISRPGSSSSFYDAYSDLIEDREKPKERLMGPPKLM